MLGNLASHVPPVTRPVRDPVCGHVPWHVQWLTYFWHRFLPFDSPCDPPWILNGCDTPCKLLLNGPVGRAVSGPLTGPVRPQWVHPCWLGAHVLLAINGSKGGYTARHRASTGFKGWIHPLAQGKHMANAIYALYLLACDAWYVNDYSSSIRRTG